MRRREFITLLGGVATAWPLGTANGDAGDRISAQHIGRRLDAFRRLVPPRPERETGFVEGENVAIEYRYADKQLEIGRLLTLENPAGVDNQGFVLSRSTSES
jgi:putative tryptophan/tyrosine transport system substrate-binding protein